MKLIMENWKKYLRESNQLEQAKPTPIIESNLKGMLLYHGTCFPPESFVDGIDPRRAHGFGQGEGFYFWTNKKRAINHTIGHILKGQNKQENCPEDADTGYIVISDEPVTPDNFDIDYEVYTSGLATFILNNLGYFFENREELGIVPPHASKRKTFREYFMEPPHQFKIDGASDTTIRLGYMTDPERASSTAEAEALGILASRLAKINSKMFRNFEMLALPKSTAVKYNGEKLIYPLRIEDIEGNVVWSREAQKEKNKVEDDFLDISSQAGRALDIKRSKLAKVLKKALENKSQNMIKRQMQGIGSKVVKKIPFIGWPFLGAVLTDKALEGDYLGMADEIIAASPVGVPYDLSKLFLRVLQTPTSRKAAVSTKLGVIDKI